MSDSSVTEDVRVQQVPGSTPARLETLLALITTSSSSSSSSTSTTTRAASNLPAMAVYFLPDDDDDNGDNDTNTTSLSSESSSLQSMDSTEWSNSTTDTSTNTMTTGSASTLNRVKTVDPLQQTPHIFRRDTINLQRTGPIAAAVTATARVRATLAAQALVLRWTTLRDPDSSTRLPNCSAT
jgi:hypothetical protein